MVMGLNLPEVFSKTFPEHLSHLKLVIQRLEEVGLNFKPWMSSEMGQ